MNRLKDKIKKKWKTMAGMTVMLMFGKSTFYIKGGR